MEVQRMLLIPPLAVWHSLTLLVLFHSTATHAQGIITVVSNQPHSGPEDDVLDQLARLPKFLPLMTPEAPLTFSLANMFGTLTVQESSPTFHGSGRFSPAGERTTGTSPTTIGLTAGAAGAGGSVFDSDLLADMMIQYQAHAKACFHEIQDQQRLLSTKIRALDAVATQAVQELSAIQYQTRTHVDQLHFVHTLARQTETMTRSLTATLEKLSNIVILHEEERDEAIETSNNPLVSLFPPVDKERYPHLHTFLAQSAQPSPPPPPTTTLISPSPSVAGSMSALSAQASSSLLARSSDAPSPLPGGSLMTSGSQPTITTTATHAAAGGAPPLAYSTPAAKAKPLAATVTSGMPTPGTGTAYQADDVGTSRLTSASNGHHPLPLRDGGGDGRQQQLLTGTIDNPLRNSTAANTAPLPSSTSLSNATTSTTTTATMGTMDGGLSSAGGSLGVVEGLSGLMSMLTKTINDGASTLAGVGQEIQRHTGGAFTAVRNPISSTTAGTTFSAPASMTDNPSEHLSSSTSSIITDAIASQPPPQGPAGLVSDATENLRRLVSSPSLRRPGRQ